AHRIVRKNIAQEVGQRTFPPTCVLLVGVLGEGVDKSAPLLVLFMSAVAHRRLTLVEYNVEWLSALKSACISSLCRWSFKPPQVPLTRLDCRRHSRVPWKCPTLGDNLVRNVIRRTFRQFMYTPDTTVIQPSLPGA